MNISVCCKNVHSRILWLASSNKIHPVFKLLSTGVLSFPQTWTLSTALFWGLGLRSTSLYWLFAQEWGGWGFYMIYIFWLTLLPGVFPMWLLCRIVWSWFLQIKVVTDSSSTLPHKQPRSKTFKDASLANWFSRDVPLVDEMTFTRLTFWRGWTSCTGPFTIGIQREAADERCLRDRSLSQGRIDKRPLTVGINKRLLRGVYDERFLRGVIDDDEP